MIVQSGGKEIDLAARRLEDDVQVTVIVERYRIQNASGGKLRKCGWRWR